jgi:D-alanine-D-alanine ligase
VDGRSTSTIAAKITYALSQRIRKMARAAFIALSASGLARVDFLFDGKRLYLNEINTLPGFTSISMYPKLWAASGLDYPTLIDILIDLAIERHDQRRSLQIDYTPKSSWYRKP